jgi:hypothetical protein
MRCLIIYLIKPRYKTERKEGRKGRKENNPLETQTRVVHVGCSGALL